MRHDTRNRIREAFGELPEDPDTRVLSRNLISVLGIAAIEERWIWDGIKGESLILKETDLPEDEVESLIKAIILELEIEGDTTRKITDGLIFINHSFVT